MQTIDRRLIKACQNGSTRTVEKLLRQGTNPNAQDDEWPYPTALLIAAKNGHTPMITLLIQYGANPHIRDDWGGTALHYAIQNRHETTTEYLITQLQLDPNAEDHNGTTPFMIAAENGDIQMLRLLVQHGTDPHATDRNGQSALHYAAIGRHRDIAEYLITNLNFDPDAQDRSGQTPFIIAATNGDIDMLRLLAQLGANPYVTDHQGRNALHYAAKYTTPKTVSFLMTYLHFDPNAQDHDGNTPLLIAVKCWLWDEGIVNTLIQLGANPHIPNHQGETPAAIARQRRIRLPKPQPSTITL